MITKNYIKMCEADNDLKWDDKSWKPKYGNYRPTQEELQKMIIKRNNYYDILVKFINFLNDCYNAMLAGNTKVIYNNFNETWFAFIAREKYNKIWTGEKWVKAGD